MKLVTQLTETIRTYKDAQNSYFRYRLHLLLWDADAYQYFLIWLKRNSHRRFFNEAGGLCCLAQYTQDIMMNPYLRVNKTSVQRINTFTFIPDMLPVLLPEWALKITIGEGRLANLGQPYLASNMEWWINSRAVI